MCHFNCLYFLKWSMNFSDIWNTSQEDYCILFNKRILSDSCYFLSNWFLGHTVYYQQNTITRHPYNQPYAMLTCMYALREVFGVQLFKIMNSLLSRIVSIVDSDWLQHARSVRGLCAKCWKTAHIDQGNDCDNFLKTATPWSW